MEASCARSTIEPIVAEERLHHGLQLGALLRTQGAQQGLHRGHPLGELLQDVVEGDGTREEPAVCGEEWRGIRLVAADPLAEQLIEVAHHLAVGGEVLRRHRPDGIGHAGGELVEDLLPETLNQRIEPFAGARFKEVVGLETPDPFADVERQGIELIEPPRRHVSKHRAEGRLVGVVGGIGLGGQVDGRGAFSPRPTLAGLVQPTPDAGPLFVDDGVELPADFGQDVVQLVPIQELLPAAIESLPQVTEAGHVAAGHVAGPPATFHQAPQGLGQIALGHHVIREGIHDLARLEIGQSLCAIPTRVPRACREAVYADFVVAVAIAPG